LAQRYARALRLHLAAKKIGKGAADLERTGMLQLLELEIDLAWFGPEILHVYPHRRGAADMRTDQGFGFCNMFGCDCDRHEDL
jgi:hypothetical protein